MERFDCLKKCNTVDIGYAEYKTDNCIKSVPVKTFINGNEKVEGQVISEDWGTDTREEAINKTLDCIGNIEQAFINIWVRKMPELIEHNGKYYIRMRLAFCN